VKVFLVDGTYELFRHHFGRPGHLNKDLREVDAVRGVLLSILQLLDEGATHIGVATDHVIESFRNALWPGYKTGEGIDATLFQQFPLLEDALMAMGVTTWARVDDEADDALASAAALASSDKRVDQVAIMTPDKDLAQCVVGGRVVQVDRRNQKIYDEDGVHEKFGVGPESIPDYLALVGDTADGFPGLSGWGAKSTATVLDTYKHIENIPESSSDWTVKVRSAGTLASTLSAEMESALLFKHLATLRIDTELFADVDELRWRGPNANFASICAELEMERLVERAEKLSRRVNG
jgi:5'-3' exonuclease